MTDHSIATADHSDARARASRAADGPRRAATFLLASPNMSGHLLRVLDIAEQLSSRGHRVLVHAKASTAPEVKAASAELIPYSRYIDMNDRMEFLRLIEPPAWMPSMPFRVAQMRGMMSAGAVTLAQELEPILRRERVDCVVYDFFDFGAAWAAERAGIPSVSAGNMGTVLTADELPLMFDALPPMRPFARIPQLGHAALNRLLPLREARKKLGLPAYAGRTAEMVRAMASSDLHIIMAHRGFAGGARLRENQAFVGPTTFNVPSATRLDAPRVEPGTVVVSTTTTPKDDGLFRRVLEAVAPMNVPVLATAAGAEEVPAGLGAHVRIERYIPHDTVFPEARALITHGGWGTVGRALIHGLPMLVIPLFGDQILNSKLVEGAGLGRRLPLKKATPEAIRAALRDLLADEALRDRARRVSAEIKQLKAEKAAARALERVVFGGEAGAAATIASPSAS